jgi:putative component of membrane protein insertase Oxa1/YidC/SpoIIIJ protein YidD
LKTILLLAIRLYRRHLSARKGYACAWRVHTGGASCSVLGYRAIRRHGAWRGLLILRVRLQRCAQAQHALTRHRPRLQSQAGYCDAPGICGEAAEGVVSGFRSARCLLSLRSPLTWLWPSRAGDAYDESEEGYSWLVQILSAAKTTYVAVLLLVLLLTLTARHSPAWPLVEGALLLFGLPWSVFFGGLTWVGVLLNFLLLSALTSLARRAEEADDEDE